MDIHSSTEQVFIKRNREQVKFVQVKGTPGEVVWNDAIDKFHYLGSKRLSGHSLKYLVYQEGQVVAALSWDAGSMKLRVRDQYIGWSP